MACCARLHCFKAHYGREAETEELVRELHSWLRKQKGYITGWIMKAKNGQGEMIRLTLWEDMDAADAVAVHPHNLSLRSRIMNVCDEYATTGGTFEVEIDEPEVASGP